MSAPLLRRVLARAGAWGPARSLAARRAPVFRQLMSKSGKAGSPQKEAADSAAAAVLCAAVAVPAALLLAFGVSPLLGLLAGAPALALAWPELRLRDAAARRREDVERELPFFSVLAAVLGEAGMPLYDVFEGLARGEIFAAMKREAMLVRRDVAVFGMSPIEAFERLAADHPSRRFAELLDGYTSKVRSGGDLPTYLSGESASQLRELEEAWGRYAGRVGLVGSMMVTVFGVLPLLLMVVGFFSPGFSVLGLALFTGAGVPLFTVVLVRLVGGMQPVAEEPPEGRAALSLLACLPGLAAGLVLGQAWVGAALGLSLFFTAYGLSVRAQIRESREVEAGLTRFTKDLLELKRQEYDLARGVAALAASNRYNPSFDRLLGKVAAGVRAGVPLDEAEVPTRSRLARVAFFIVGQMSRSGGGTVDTVFQLSSYCTKIVETKRSARAEMKPYLALSYASPLLLAFGVTFVKGVLETFSRAVQPSFGALSISVFHIGSVPPALMQVSDLLIVVSAAALGLVGAKINDFTVRNTLPSSLNVAIAVGAMAAMAALGSGALPHLPL